jgi:hypothetical protein
MKVDNNKKKDTTREYYNELTSASR